MNKIVCVLCILLSGCSVFKYEPIRLEGERKRLETRSERMEKITARLEGASLREALDLMPYVLNIVYEGNSYDKSVTLDAEEMPVDEYMYACARSAGVDVERHGTVWIFRASEEKKEAVTPLKAGIQPNQTNLYGGNFIAWVDLAGWSQEEIGKMVTDGSLTWVAGDKYKFTGDLRSCIDMYESVDVMRNNARCQYAFELVCMTRDLELKAGLEEELGMSWNWRQQLAEGMSIREWSLLYSVAAKASASGAMNRSSMILSGVMREGVEYKSNIGNQIPYIKRSVSDSGTVSDTSVEYLDVGVTFSLVIQGASLGICRFNLDQSEVNGYLNGYPIKHRSHMETMLHVDGDEMRYVGSFFKKSRQRRLLFMSDDLSQWDVYIRVLRLDRGQRVEKATKEIKEFTKREKN